VAASCSVKVSRGLQQLEPSPHDLANLPDAYSISSIQQAGEKPREHHNSDVDYKDQQEKRAKPQVI
jgi:hypothetical protein